MAGFGPIRDELPCRCDGGAAWRCELASSNAEMFSVAKQVGSSGNFEFNVNTITGLNYVFETTTNLATQLWTPVLTNNTGVTGAIAYQTNNTVSPNQFFRLMFP